MKKTFLALIISISILPLFGQDSTTIKHKHHHQDNSSSDSTHRFIAKPYLLYNYTAQSANNVFNRQIRDDANNSFVVDGDYFSNSKGMPAGFGYDLVFNQPIPQALIDRTDKHLGKELKLDESLNSGLDYMHYFRKADLTLIIGYHFRQMLNAAAPKQAFETGFYGNARFEGDTANLSNIHFDYYNYNQLSIGFIKKIDYGSYQMQVGLTGSFLQVSNNIDISTGPTTLYTAPYGESVDINYDLTYNQASAGSTKFFALNGIGASGDFDLSFSNKDKWKFSFDIKDLGIISFRLHEINYSGSNNVNFQGIVIPNLLDFNSSTFSNLNVGDTVLSKLPSLSNNQYSVFLPFTANMAFSKPLLNDRLVLTAGLQYKFLPNYNPYGYVKVNYFIKSDMIFSASVGAGGYSLCDVGVEFAKSWKYFDFAVGSSNLLGLVLPNYYSGSAFYLRLGTTF